VTRGGIIEDIYFKDVRMDSINIAFQFNLNWNPSYSYSTLPSGYDPDSVPAHWKAMLNKVEPAEKGIPLAKDIYVSNVTITNANTVFSGTGLKNSALKNFNFSKVSIGAASLGAVEYTSDWNFNDFSISIVPKAIQLKNVSGKENEERLK
jgi:hypothetical protein